MSNQTDKRTASQRIEDLERAMMSLYQTADNMARDLGTIKDAIKLLGNKVDAIVKASSSSQPINDDVIAAIMVQNNVEELKQKVSNLVAQGVLSAEESITETSFVVGSEVKEDGTVANPRLQFTMQALQPELREKLKGAKAGQTVTLQEGKLLFNVLETYAIQQPKAPEQSQEEAPAAEPSSEQASS